MKALLGGDRIDYTEVNGFTISTVDTSDYGLETALKDSKKPWCVIRRYDTEEEAQEGHNALVEYCTSNNTITFNQEYIFDSLQPADIELRSSYN